MIRLLKYILLFIVFFVVEAEKAGANDVARSPEPTLSPKEVVQIQLNALKNKDQKDIRFGILKTWQFAHPRNKSITGPFERFSKMITKTVYSVLLNHLSHNIILLEKKSDQAIYQVEIISETGGLFSMDWVVSIVKLGTFKDCWMTSDVSLPLLKGTAI